MAQRDDEKPNSTPKKDIESGKKPSNVCHIRTSLLIPLFLPLGEINNTEEKDDEVDDQEDNPTGGFKSFVDCQEAEDRVKDDHANDHQVFEPVWPNGFG